VLALAFVSVLTTVAVVVAGLTGLVLARRTASAAADLAALAGAGALAQGEDACAAAAEVSERNGALLAACEPSGTSVTVGTTVEALSVFGWVFTASGRARAGPV
jgi:secretion/DNA translocation related TadE-like protein